MAKVALTHPNQINQTLQQRRAEADRDLEPIIRGLDDHLAYALRVGAQTGGLDDTFEEFEHSITVATLGRPAHSNHLDSKYEGDSYARNRVREAARSILEESPYTVTDVKFVSAGDQDGKAGLTVSDRAYPYSWRANRFETPEGSALPTPAELIELREDRTAFLKAQVREAADGAIVLVNQQLRDRAENGDIGTSPFQEPFELARFSNFGPHPSVWEHLVNDEAVVNLLKREVTARFEGSPYKLELLRLRPDRSEGPPCVSLMGKITPLGEYNWNA